MKEHVVQYSLAGIWEMSFGKFLKPTLIFRKWHFNINLFFFTH